MQAGVTKPTDEALAASLAKLKDTYREQYARTGSQRQRELAHQFLELAARDDVAWTPSDRFVLLDQAREVALRAGDLETAFSAIDALVAAFAIEERPLRCEAVVAIAPDARTSEAGRFASLAVRFIEDLLSAGEWESAAPVLDSAETLARKSRDGDLKRRVEDLRSAIADARRVVELEERIKLQPDDPEANRQLGLYYCFSVDDFEQGLPYLARGDDEGLREAAALDLATPQLPADCKKVGESWHAWGKGRQDRAGLGALARARHWYALAVPGLTRFDAVAVEATLRDLDAALEKLAADPEAEAEIATPRSAPAVLRQLEQARSTYEAEMERIRGMIEAELAASEGAAVEAGFDMEQGWQFFNRARMAREALEENGDFPLPPLIPASLQDRIDRARDKHRATLERVLRVLSRSGKDVEAAELEQELAEFDADPSGLHARMARMPAPQTSVQVIGERSRGYGTWINTDGVLRCPEGGTIAFGDPEWADYDLVVTVRIDDEVEPQQFSIFARLEGNESWELNAGGWGISNRDLRPQVEGDPFWSKSPHRAWMSGIQPTEPGDTYSLGLRLRGETVAVLIDGEEVRESYHPELRDGRVGFWARGQGTTAFLDVEVRDSDGRLLWKGLPEVPE